MIKTSYDSQGKVNCIHIQIDDYFAQVPWNSNTQLVEWESITYEPTKQSIKAAWDSWVEGKDLLVELGDRPDLAPTPEQPKPNWAVFNRLCVQSPVILQILTTTANQFAAHQLQLIASPAGYATGGLDKADYPLFQYVWSLVIDGLPQPPTSEMVAELNIVAANANMDFSFNSQGKIEITSN